LHIPLSIFGGLSSNGIYEYDTKCIGQLMYNLAKMIDVDASECAVQANYKREMAVVRSLEGGSKGVNALVKGVVRGAYESIVWNILEIDAFVCNEPESLHALNIPFGFEGNQRKLAEKVLFLKWSVKEDDDQNKEGETKRNDSMKKEKEKKRKWLIQLIDDSDVLRTASSAGHVRVVERILEVVGINVNVYDGAPLYFASKNGHIKVVKALLAAKDINLKQAFGGSTPLDIATQENHTEIKQLLKAAGATEKNRE
jgi:hypothetical protein